METPKGTALNEVQLYEFIEKGVNAIRAKDINTLLPLFAADIVSFDVVGQLRYVGTEAIQKRMETWFSSFKEGPIGYEISELNVDIATDMAFCHRINHVSGSLQTGQQLDMRWRETSCYRKLDGQWLIIHQHSSAPFDPASGMASLSLEA
ncbi:YybH family protein [Spirosoma arcticum]